MPFLYARVTRDHQMRLSQLIPVIRKSYNPDKNSDRYIGITDTPISYRKTIYRSVETLRMIKTYANTFVFALLAKID